MWTLGQARMHQPNLPARHDPSMQQCLPDSLESRTSMGGDRCIVVDVDGQGSSIKASARENFLKPPQQSRRHTRSSSRWILSVDADYPGFPRRPDAMTTPRHRAVLWSLPMLLALSTLAFRWRQRWTATGICALLHPHPPFRRGSRVNGR